MIRDIKPLTRVRIIPRYVKYTYYDGNKKIIASLESDKGDTGVIISRYKRHYLVKLDAPNFGRLAFRAKDLTLIDEEVSRV
jgi:hypothetical protein